MESARLATAGDVPVLAVLAEEAAAAVAPVRGGARYVGNEALAAPYGSTLGDLVDRDDAAVFVGLIDEVVVGFAAVWRRADRTGAPIAQLGALYVVEGGRGVGVGEAMMDLALAWARQAGCIGVEAVALAGDRATKNFFEAFGLTARAILVHRSLYDDAEVGEEGSDA